eukprot:scaffold17636_cov120-Isochrysis_galbana.AAC.1
MHHSSARGRQATAKMRGASDDPRLGRSCESNWNPVHGASPHATGGVGDPHTQRFQAINARTMSEWHTAR